VGSLSTLLDAPVLAGWSENCVAGVRRALCHCWSGPLVSAVMWQLPGSRATGRLTLRAQLLRPLSADGAGGPWQSWLRQVGVVPLLLHCECSRDRCSCAGGAHSYMPAFAGALANERPSISYEC
jgi:hypothetical protein